MKFNLFVIVLIAAIIISIVACSKSENTANAATKTTHVLPTGMPEGCVCNPITKIKYKDGVGTSKWVTTCLCDKEIYTVGGTRHTIKLNRHPNKKVKGTTKCSPVLIS